MSNKILKVGVIGTSFGGFTHVPGFQSNDSCQVVALCGRNKEKAQKVAQKWEVADVTTDYNELVDRKDIDIITVAAPPHLHFDIVKKSLANKKHVLCEKPFALNTQEAIALYKEAQASNVCHLLSHQLRFHRNFDTVKKVLNNGDLGRIIHVNLKYSTSNRADANIPWTWWSDREVGGGELNAIGSHMIDLLRWWFGDVDSVIGQLQTATAQRKDPKTQELRDVTSDDVASFQLNFKNGVLGTCIVSSVAIGWKGFSIQIFGEKGALYIEGDTQLSFIRNTQAEYNLSFKDPLLSEGWVSGSIWRASFKRMVDNYVAGIQGKAAISGATFSDGVDIQRIMDAIRISDRDGRRVSVSEITAGDNKQSQTQATEVL